MTEDCVKTLDEKLADWQRRQDKRKAEEEEAEAERLARAKRRQES